MSAPCYLNGSLTSLTFQPMTKGSDCTLADSGSPITVHNHLEKVTWDISLTSTNLSGFGNDSASYYAHEYDGTITCTGIPYNHATAGSGWFELKNSIATGKIYFEITAAFGLDTTVGTYILDTASMSIDKPRGEYTIAFKPHGVQNLATNIDSA